MNPELEERILAYFDHGRIGLRVETLQAIYTLLTELDLDAFQRRCWSSKHDRYRERLSLWRDGFMQAAGVHRYK